MFRSHLKIIQNFPIRRKLMVFGMLTSAVSLLASSTLFMLNELNIYQRELYEDLTSLAEIVGINSAAAISFRDKQAALDTLSSVRAKKNVLAVYLFDRDGLFFTRHLTDGDKMRSVRLEVATTINPEMDFRNQLNELSQQQKPFWSIEPTTCIARPIIYDQQKIGTVVIFADMSMFRQHIALMVLVTCMIMVCVFAFSFALARRLQLFISAPIMCLVETMNEVSATKNYALRAEKQNDDEIGQLFFSFNEMLTEIEARNETLRHRQDHLDRLAHFDELTALPNRTLFFDRLQQALHHAAREKEAVAVLFLDLDHFKDVNDSLGHRVGDILLKAVAERLTAVVRLRDTVARLGGDEFTLFTQNIGNSDNACVLAKKLTDIFANPFHLEGREVYVTASIGIAIFPFDGHTADDLLKNADIAMYHAKDQGKNLFQLYREDMNQKSTARLEMTSELHQALQNGDFELYYQPKIALADGRMTGVEALVRWNHPLKGQIPPIKFIQLAEDTGLIIPLSNWVLMEACRQAKSWQLEGHAALRVAVNLSAHQFKKNDLVATVFSVLDATGLDPAFLELELTESALIDGDTTTINALKEFRQRGIKISIDDFGTGYSSLSYLHRFPIDALKIDRSFVWNITKSEDDAVIISAIIAMAQSLKLNVIAEGVETEEQLAYLKRAGCNEVQGYLFSRPLTVGQLQDMLTDRVESEAAAGE